MKILFKIILVLVFSLLIFPQDKRFTRGAENGYMWIDYEKYSIMRDMKYDYLSSMLERQRVIIFFRSVLIRLAAEKILRSCWR